MFMSEDTARALANSTLKLDDSFGLAAHAGIDFKVNDRGAIRLDARWIDIDTDAARSMARPSARCASIHWFMVSPTSSGSDRLDFEYRQGE